MVREGRCIINTCSANFVQRSRCRERWSRAQKIVIPRTIPIRRWSKPLTPPASDILKSSSITTKNSERKDGIALTRVTLWFGAKTWEAEKLSTAKVRWLLHCSTRVATIIRHGRTPLPSRGDCTTANDPALENSAALTGQLPINNSTCPIMRLPGTDEWFGFWCLNHLHQ